MIIVERTGNGPVFRIRALPGSSRRSAGGEKNGSLKVRTTFSPEKGKANADIIKIVAAALDLRRSQVTLIAGEKSREKKILVTGLEPEDLESKLEILAVADS